MPGTITNLEIFGAGTHSASTGRITVTEHDLDEIVAAFDALQGTSIVKPHLKLGHTDSQKWFGQDKGAPALGWITKVWREGRKLLATVADVPEAMLDLIRQGRYHNVSAEIFFDAPIEVNGRKWSRVLSAVALLGVEMPAVKDLAGLAAALFSFEKKVDADPIEFSQEKPMPDPVMYNQDQVDALVAAAETRVRSDLEASHTQALSAQTAQITTVTAERDAARSELTTVRASAAEAAATRLVDEAIRTGHLLPKQKAFAMAFLTTNSGPVKFGDSEKTLPELFTEFLKNAGKQVDLEEKGSGQNGRKEFANASEEVTVKSKELATKDKISFEAAKTIVLDADPELKSRYAFGQ